MRDVRPRMTDANKIPDARSISRWIGPANYKRWTRLVKLIESNYPGTFMPEWLFGGKTHGWYLRFKRSKSFCSLIPEQGQFVVQIVFGGVEREKAKAMLDTLSPGVRQAYRAAKTYHDGKWLGLAVERDELLDDIWRLLALKRKPRG